MSFNKKELFDHAVSQAKYGLEGTNPSKSEFIHLVKWFHDKYAVEVDAEIFTDAEVERRAAVVYADDLS